MKMQNLLSLSFPLVFLMMISFIASDGYSQDQSSKKQTEAIQRRAAVTGYITRIVYDRKLADKLELTPIQKKELSILIQKMQDSMMKRRSPATGKKYDFKDSRKVSEEFESDAKSVLSEKQWELLEKLAEESRSAQQAVKKSFSPEKSREIRRLSGLMSQLMRLSYDRKLAEELEVSAEQKVEIREVQQKFQEAMQDRAKNATFGQFDFDAYTKAMEELMTEAQTILTPDQSEQLARKARLTQLKTRHGDPFAMINGLAEDFDLDPKETEKLKDEIESARDDYYAELKQLQKDTLERIIKRLPSENRQEVRDSLEGYFEQDPRKTSRNPLLRQF